MLFCVQDSDSESNTVNILAVSLAVQFPAHVSLSFAPSDVSLGSENLVVFLMLEFMCGLLRMH